MRPRTTTFVAHSSLDSNARRDRQDVYQVCQNPFRGFQLGFAMADAAIKTQSHPLAAQIGRCIRSMS